MTRKYSFYLEIFHCGMEFSGVGRRQEIEYLPSFAVASNMVNSVHKLFLVPINSGAEGVVELSASPVKTLRSCESS